MTFSTRASLQFSAFFAKHFDATIIFNLFNLLSLSLLHRVDTKSAALYTISEIKGSEVDALFKVGCHYKMKPSSHDLNIPTLLEFSNASKYRGVFFPSRSSFPAPCLFNISL